jgi:hypothetical protein
VKDKTLLSYVPEKQSCSTHIFSESGKLELISVSFATASGADISYENVPIIRQVAEHVTGPWLSSVLFFISPH